MDQSTIAAVATVVGAAAAAAVAAWRRRGNATPDSLQESQAELLRKVEAMAAMVIDLRDAIDKADDKEATASKEAAVSAVQMRGVLSQILTELRSIAANTAKR